MKSILPFTLAVSALIKNGLAFGITEGKMVPLVDGVVLLLQSKPLPQGTKVKAWVMNEII